ncbi:MAG: bifunctional glutamate N-acetyltransferase/amino-acid acetyltransferase ArgJ [Brevirhabdus sp.]
MSKTKEIAKLKAKVKKLRKKLKTATAHKAPAVSPLAPKQGFPPLPMIDGVRFATIAAGVRYTTGRADVMLAELCPGTTLAGVFTKSATRAAPVLDCQAKMAAAADSDAGAAIIVNAGNANAFTGGVGSKAVDAVTGAVARCLDIPQNRVFSASTGVIGEPLPHDRITNVLEELRSSFSDDGIEAAANAIRTTDTFAKGAGESIVIDGATVHIAGIAKGSGMIAPDMATMLVYIFTDAKIDRAVLQPMLSSLNENSFNSITVDSDTSTSDTLMLAATGRADMAPITSTGSSAAEQFRNALSKVMTDLAQQVVRDGEGATKFVQVSVSGARSAADAKRVAMAIANSPLVKTAIAGEDPNWGRVVMAIGKSGAEADRDRISIRFGDIVVAEQGWVSPSYKEEDGAAYMKRDEISMLVDLGIADGSATVWTCDLTHQYIAINADYRS